MQVEPRSQLILVSHQSSSDASAVSKTIQGVNSSVCDSSSLHQLEASDVLMAPKILENRMVETSDQTTEICNIAATQLKAVQQAVILAQCLAIKKDSRSDEYQGYKMGPFIQAIDSQQSSHFMILYFCNILRVQWESTRTRTMQRALLMMTKLVETLNEPSPVVAQRIYYCFTVNSPTIPALLKEFGDLLVSCGLIGEAIKVYEDLELWVNLIVCYTMLEKKAAAVESSRRNCLKGLKTQGYGVPLVMLHLMTLAIRKPLKSQATGQLELCDLLLAMHTIGETINSLQFYGNQQ